MKMFQFFEANYKFSAYYDPAFHDLVPPGASVSSAVQCTLESYVKVVEGL